MLGKEGCACDFDYDPTWEELLPEETERARTNLLKLAAYLREASNVGGPLELYAGFCDEMALPPTSRGAITPEQLLLCRLNQSERKFFTISRSNNQR